MAIPKYPLSANLTEHSNTSSSATTATSTMLEALSQYRFLSLVPQNREMTNIHPTSSEVFTDEGITISLPWTGEPNIQSRTGVGTQIKFPDGNFVMLANPYPFEDIRQNFLSSAGASAANHDKLFQLLGSYLQSNEAFFDVVISTNLDWLTSSTSSPEEVYLATELLPVKLSLFFESTTHAIYRFSTPRFRIFEFTDLPVKKQSYLFLFDNSDTGRLITTSGNQNEIDFIVSSLRES